MSAEVPRRGAGSGVDAIHEPHRWDGVDVPTGAYSRVSDPERYRSLHAFGLALADDLEAEFDVLRWTDPPLPPGFDAGVEIVGAVRLQPRAADAAAITIALTAFPGLIIGFGEFTRVPFPFCGCDACDERFEDVVDAVREHVDAVVSGGFAEAGEEWSSFRTPRMSVEGGSTDAGSVARAWRPWSSRPAAS